MKLGSKLTPFLTGLVFLAGTLSFANEVCEHFYSSNKIPIQSNSSGTQVVEIDNETRMQQMDAYSHKILHSLSSTEVLPSDFFNSAISHLRAKNNVHFEAGQVRRTIELVSSDSPQNEQIERGLNNFQSRIQQLTSKIEALSKERTKKTGLFRSTTNKSKDDFELMAEINDLYAGLEKDLEFLTEHKGYVNDSQREIRNQHTVAVDLEKRANGYLSDISFLGSSFMINQAQYPFAIQKAGIIGSLFSGERSTAENILQQAKTMKLNLETRAGTNALAVQYINQQHDYTLNSLFIQSGITPQKAKQIIDDFQKQLEADRTKQELSIAKRAKVAAMLTKLKKVVLVPAVVASIFGGGGYGFYEFNTPKSVQSLYEQSYAKIAEVTRQQKAIMQKYRSKVPDILLNYIEIVKSPKMVADYLSKMDPEKALDPEFIIYMTNYSPQFFSKDSAFQAASFAKIIDTFLLRKITREYTPNEKIEIVEGIGILNERWAETVRIQIKGGNEESLSRTSQKEMETYFNNRISHQLAFFENIRKAELKAAAVKKLSETPRVKIMSEDNLILMANASVNPNVETIFSSGTDQDKINKIMDYAKLGKLTNYDLIYILKKFENMTVVTGESEKTVEFYKRRYEIAKDGVHGQAEIRHLAIEVIFQNTKLEPMNVHEMNLLRDLLSNSKIQVKGNGWDEYTKGTIRYFMSLLESKTKLAE